MNATSHLVDYDDAPDVSDIRISREMANETSDVDTLIYWFECLDERIVQMKSFMSSLRDAEVDDEEYFRRTGGALAFAKMSSTWVERRLLTLGVTPPYPPNDPRARTLNILNESIRKLKAQVADLIRDRDGSGEAGQTAQQAGPVGQQPGPERHRPTPVASHPQEKR